MKFVIRRYHDEFFKTEVAPAPDSLHDKIVTILEHGYHFGIQDLEFVSFVFIERQDHDGTVEDVAIETIVDGSEWDEVLMRLVATGYDIAIHDPYIQLGIVPDHYDDQITAEDANLKVPFTPFDTEGTTNED